MSRAFFKDPSEDLQEVFIPAAVCKPLFRVGDALHIWSCGLKCTVSVSVNPPDGLGVLIQRPAVRCAISTPLTPSQDIAPWLRAQFIKLWRSWRSARGVLQAPSNGHKVMQKFTSQEVHANFAGINCWIFDTFSYWIQQKPS